MPRLTWDKSQFSILPLLFLPPSPVIPSPSISPTSTATAILYHRLLLTYNAFSDIACRIRTTTSELWLVTKKTIVLLLIVSCYPGLELQHYLGTVNKIAFMNLTEGWIRREGKWVGLGFHQMSIELWLGLKSEEYLL